MSIFSSLFGANESDKNTKTSLPWIPLVDLGQLNEITKRSFEVPVLVFKHSTRCSISRMALKQFEKEFDPTLAVPLYFLDLLEYRAISNALAERFQVVHQSPQVMLIQDGKAVYDASHSEIDAEGIKNIVKG